MVACENNGNELFIKYSEYIFSSGKTFRMQVEYMRNVLSYVNSMETYSMKSYREYMKMHLTDRLYGNLQKEAILDFLSFIGRGSVRRRKVRAERPLERLEKMSERNLRTVNMYADWLLSENDFSKSTTESYVYTVKDFFRYSNEFSLEQAKRYIRSLEELGRKPKTINLRITGLEKFSEYLGKPIKMKRPKIPKVLEVENVPTEEEYLRLLAYLKGKSNQDYYFWIRVLATTGARVSEFLQFRWEDVLKGEVILKGKGNKYRRFFFNKGLQAEVKKYVYDNRKSGMLAKGRYGVISSRGFSSNLKNWGKACGIDSRKMHAHAFRHFFAKMFLKKNKDVVQLAEILGHGSIDTTRIYLQKSYEEQKRDFNRNVTW